MPYQLEPVTAEEERKILADAVVDESKRRRLLSRGGYIASKMRFFWAIDHEADSYLITAPKFDFKALRYNYFFFFRGKFYEFHTKAPLGPVVHCDWGPNPPQDDERQAIKAALLAAFAVHGILGLPEEQPFTPVFEDNA